MILQIYGTEKLEIIWKKGAFAEFLIEQMNATEDNSENDEDTESNAILRLDFLLNLIFF